MLTNRLDGPVPEHLVGEAWPAVQPGADPVLLGHAKLEPSDPVAVRTAQTFTLTYTVGRYGLDDTGAIRVAFRVMTDFGRLQVTDPAAPGYVSARTSGKARILLDYAGFGVASRPRWRALTARVSGGYLSEGDTIAIVFGDTSGGSPGMKMQTFVEGALPVQGAGRCLRLRPFHADRRYAEHRNRARTAGGLARRALLPAPAGRTLPLRPQGRGCLGQSDAAGRGRFRLRDHAAGEWPAGTLPL